MKNHQIVFLDSYTNNPGDISFAEIEIFGSLTVYDRTSIQQLSERAEKADILIVNKFVIDNDSLAFLPNVRYIVVAATGYNNIDLIATSSRNIVVSNVRGYSTTSVTQHVFASIFALLNRIEYYNAEVKKGRWSSSFDFCFYDAPIQEVSGLNLGIIGYGNIGRRVGEVGHAFGMNIMIPKRNSGRHLPLYVEEMDINDLFSKSDILTLHCPLNVETKEIINLHNLRKMKKEAIVVNTGRGPLINEFDLVYALDNGMISGAALDVMSQEPPNEDHILSMHPKCLVTPHIAWASQSARKKLVSLIAENIQGFLNNQIINQVN